MAEVLDVDRPTAVVAPIRFSQRHFKAVLVTVTILGLLLRVAYVWFDRRHTFYGGDPLYFHSGANLLADGKGFINPYAYARHKTVQAADHPPLYMIYLAVFSLFGVTTITGHLLASTLIGAASVAVAGMAGREIGGERIGLVAAVLVAVYPNTWRYDGMLLSESMVILTVLVAIWLAYRYWHRPTRWRMVGVGVAVGLTALSRSELILLALLLVVPLALLTPGASRSRRLRRLAGGLLGVLVIVGPWVGYNLSRFDHAVFLSENLGGTLATSNCQQTYYGSMLGYWYYPCGQNALDRAGIGPYAFNGAADRVQREAGIAYMKSHKSRVPVVVAARVGRITDLFRPRQGVDLDVYLENATRWVANLGLYTFYPMALLAAAGAVLLRRRREAVFPLLAPVATVILTCALFYAATRFRASAEGALCLLAAVALDAAYAALRRTRREPAPAPDPAPVGGAAA